MDHADMVSPKILQYKWGQIEVEKLGVGRDFKLWPGGGRAWDWNEFGTSHSGGIQVAEVSELIEKGAKTIILTRGVLLRLKVPDRTLQYLEKNGIEYIIASTKQGVKIYNECVAKNLKVGGLFHSTC